MISYFVILANFIQRNPDAIANQSFTMHSGHFFQSTSNIVNYTFSIDNERILLFLLLLLPFKEHFEFLFLFSKWNLIIL